MRVSWYDPGKVLFSELPATSPRILSGVISILRKTFLWFLLLPSTLTTGPVKGDLDEADVSVPSDKLPLPGEGSSSQVRTVPSGIVQNWFQPQVAPERRKRVVLCWGI